MGVVGVFSVPYSSLVRAARRGGAADSGAAAKLCDEASRHIAKLRPDSVVIASPHAPCLRDRFFVAASREYREVPSEGDAAKALVCAPCDKELADAIAQAAHGRGLPVMHRPMEEDRGDKGSLGAVLSLRDAGLPLDCPVVRLGLSGLPPAAHRLLGAAAAEAAHKLNRRVVFIACCDTAPGEASGAPEAESPVSGQPSAEAAASAESALAALVEGATAYVVPEGNTASVEDAGPKLCPTGDPEPDADAYVELARASVEVFVRTGRTIRHPLGLPPEIGTTNQSLFVSLYSDGALRGRAGSMIPQCACTADEVIRHAVSACSGAGGFAPVEKGELDRLSYAVDVVSGSDIVRHDKGGAPRRES